MRKILRQWLGIDILDRLFEETIRDIVSICIAKDISPQELGLIGEDEVGITRFLKDMTLQKTNVLLRCGDDRIKELGMKMREAINSIPEQSDKEIS